MLLADILHILLDEVDSINYTNQEFYELLFLRAESPTGLELEDTVKKVFSNSKGRRPLPGNIAKQFCSRKGFLDLSVWIESHYLCMVNYENQSLYRKLCSQIQKCPYLPDNYKKELSGSFDPASTFHLAELISCCIILGNYNTRQASAKEPCIKDQYKLGLDFMEISRKDREKTYPMADRIWEASQKFYQYSHEEGRRFHSLDIIQRLLPKGYLSDSILNLRGETVDGSISSIIELCNRDHRNMVVIGEGGIGKTTFLQQILENHFLNKKSENNDYFPYKSGVEIPVFIELNRCPSTIGSWYDSSLKKTNFITRYICQLLEDHLSLEDVNEENLKMLEKEFQKMPSRKAPEYLLLLDGFNEVSTGASAGGKSIRSYLSDEISMLHTYPNVRLITTSRETQSAAFMEKFQSVRLLGLEDSDITDYLKDCQMPDTSIGITMANKQLVTCLRVPLFLCMFASEYGQTELLPETSGEILYCFFHRDSAFYNARQRSADTHTNPLNALETSVILDFVLPYIGWFFERNDAFSVSADKFEAAIQSAFGILHGLFLQGKSNPFEDFQYNCSILADAVQSLYLENGTLRTQDITACIHSYLGILYQYSDSFADTQGKSRYAFIHHHFRDYFSSIFDIQLLRMLPYIEATTFCESVVSQNPKSRPKDASCNSFLHRAGIPHPISYDYFLNSYFWQSQKISFISQILMEHRNRPVMDEQTGNWMLPSPAFPEQKVLTNALDFCRLLTSMPRESHYLLQNILSAMVYGRDELSGLNLSGLDFRHCNLFNIPCSKKGASRFLSADFSGSALYSDCFQTPGHLDDVIEYIYRNGHCYSLDLSGTIKCWDILSGKLEYTLHSESPAGLYDFSSRGFMRISNDGHWLAVKVQPEIPADEGAYVALFNLYTQSDVPVSLVPKRKAQVITTLSFTDDMEYLLLLADCHYLSCYHIPDGTQEYEATVTDFMKYTDIYAKNATAPVYAFTNEYNEFEMDIDSYFSDDAENGTGGQEQDDYIDLDEDWEEDEGRLAIPCALYKYDPVSDKTEELYTFISTPGTLPTAAYFPCLNCFILYNHTNGQMEKFDCDFLLAEPVWESITQKEGMPAFILSSAENPKECYIMYPDVCYEMDLCSEQENGLIMSYAVGPMNRLLTEYELDAEDGLRFQASTAPSGTRILVRSDRTVYEWNTTDDSLTPRYNSVYYGCTGLIADLLHDCSILVHLYNGVSIFQGTPKKLTASYCFPYTDYCIEDCAYHEKTQRLALRFYRPGHEFIKVLNLKDSSSRIIFSAMKDDFTQSMVFSPDGNFLLICTFDDCIEYDFTTDISYTVSEHLSDDNEAFVGADYISKERSAIHVSSGQAGHIGQSTENEIAIAVAARKSSSTVRPRCDYYRRLKHGNSIAYQRKWGYYIPTLPLELAEAFVHQNHDVGVGCAYNEDGMQSYWLTQGFFKDTSSATDQFLTVECFKYEPKNQTRKKQSPKKLERFQFVYVRHDFCIDNPQRVGGTHYCYSHLNDDFSKTVCIRDHEELYLWENLKKEPENPLFLHSGSEKDYGNAYWEFAIPAGSNRLLCCFENYHLAEVDMKNGRISDEIPYTPSIAISGCRFKNIIADEDTKCLLRNNGGLVN